MRRFLWLPILSGITLLLWILFAAISSAKFNASDHLTKTTVQNIAQDKPTYGWYEVSGGIPNYVFAQAVDFDNDKDKDAGHNYNSFVPYIDPKSKQVLMLVEYPQMSPSDFIQLVDQGVPLPATGTFYDPSKIDPQIFSRFAARSYSVPADTPVMLMYDSPDPSKLKSKLITTAIIALLIGGVPWGIMAIVGRPKKRSKTFSERYPDRKVY
jgi:hypothetical protein